MARTRPPARLRLALALVLALALTGLAAVAGVTVAAGPASADVFDDLERVHTEQVTGDVVTVGNAVLVCPGEPDDARDDCLAASRGQNQQNNNSFAMRYADVDGVDATVNSSRAAVGIPAGSRVTYARLSWAGNRSGPCQIGDRATYPDGTAEDNEVLLTVGDGPSRRIAPGEYTDDVRSIGYYSADTEVTGAFADLPVTGADREVRITVGDVYAGEGVGCFGGWSLTLVHTADAAGCDAQRREVFVYDGHVRQGTGDDPQSVRVSGFRVAGGGAVRAGVTAYEGDNGQVGDRLRVNGTPLADPATGKDDNFFASTAQGRVVPDYPNNFSVDAKRVVVPDGVVEPGDTEATVGVSTGAASNADAFLLQGLTLSVPVPSLCLQKSVSPTTARVGDTVEWRLVVRNPSAIDATDVRITDPAVADCEQPAFDLAGGASRTVTCTSVATEDLVNVASVAGTGGGVTLSAVDSTPLTVVDPSVEITKTAVEEAVVEGERAGWTLRVRNTGDTALTDLVVDDPLVGDCDAERDRLDRGEEWTFRCDGRVTTDLTNTATVTAEAPAGPPVQDSDSATVTVEPAPTDPAVEITKTAVEDRVDAGGRARWDITVTNTGSGELTDVAVDDPLVPSCDETFAAVPEGGSRDYRCGTTVRADLVNEATVTATGDGDVAVTDTDSAEVAVEGPFGVTVTPARDRTVPGEDVDVTVELTNDGSQPVADLVVTGTNAADDCTRRRPIVLLPGDSRSYDCTAVIGEGGGDVRAGVSALGELGGIPTRVRDSAPVEVLVPEIAVALDVVAPAEGTDGRTEVEVSNPGETPLRAVRVGVTGATLCQMPDAPLAAGASITLTCAAARGDVNARVSAQPALDGAALGPRVRATATDTSDNGGLAPIGDGEGPDPSDPDSPYTPDDPGTTSPDGLLPDTGASRAMLPVALLGGGMLAAGVWLLRRTRHRRPTP